MAGRKLPVPESPGLRPTTDRVRETLFNWLAPSIVDANCLDCFAGSGALGLEALSRYAASATLLEMETRRSRSSCKKIWRRSKPANAKVVNTNTLAFLAQAARRITSCLSIPRFVKDCLKKR
ncbi:ribosomal RNA small subunit methyltransferase D [Klebsiella michiganensis]|uniref:Ribosomal RNA small subunit methyltransferase D n=1 Tax=Klebsiella michiganensis TaxID=1134687 RepID=A0A7H4PG79_9ENTR|nr:ribosomal RNA small subunit methyltransferase D [Klebsiella michiganensis]